MPKPTIVDGGNCAEREFETFPLHKYHYEFLKRMPKGAHCHFSGIYPQKLRSSVAALNARTEKEGMHFAVYAVGENDKKGPGLRVLRDDLPRRKRRPGAGRSKAGRSKA